MLTDVSTVLHAAELEFKARRGLWDLKIDHVKKEVEEGSEKRERENRSQKREQIELFGILRHIKHRV